jgi:hypothetical protein
MGVGNSRWHAWHFKNKVGNFLTAAFDHRGTDELSLGSNQAGRDTERGGGADPRAAAEARTAPAGEPFAPGPPTARPT